MRLTARRTAALVVAFASALFVAGCGADVTINTSIAPNGSGTKTITFSIAQSDLQQENMTGQQMANFLSNAAPSGLLMTSDDPSSDPATYTFQYNFSNFQQLQNEERLLMEGGTPQDTLTVQKVSPFLTRYAYSDNANPQSYIQWALNAASSQNLANQGSLINSVNATATLPGVNTGGPPGSAPVVGIASIPVTVHLGYQFGLLGDSQVVKVTWPKDSVPLNSVKKYLAAHHVKGSNWTYSNVGKSEEQAAMTVSGGTWTEVSQKMRPLFQESLTTTDGPFVNFFQRQATLTGSVDPVSWLGVATDGNGSSDYVTNQYDYGATVSLGNATGLREAQTGPGLTTLTVVVPVLSRLVEAAVGLLILLGLIVLLSTKRVRMALGSRLAVLSAASATRAAVAATAPQASFCPECGSQIPSGATFCGECGHRLKS